MKLQAKLIIFKHIFTMNYYNNLYSDNSTRKIIEKKSIYEESYMLSVLNFLGFIVITSFVDIFMFYNILSAFRTLTYKEKTYYN